MGHRLVEMDLFWSSVLETKSRRHYAPYFTMIKMQKIGGLPIKHQELSSRNRRFTGKIVASARKSLCLVNAPRNLALWCTQGRR